MSSSLSFWDILKYSYRVIGFKLEQRKLTTSEFFTIKTKKGDLKGVKRLTIWGDSYISFEKIPFAKPPLGNLRFKAPEPNEPWAGILDCTNFSEKPIQSNVLFRKYKGSEDCLYLNVYTNNITPVKPRPVMVWIYGGGFQLGEASRDLYSPDFFMTKDIVLVTIQYRLGPFGFLSFNDPEVNIPGNTGLKDQVMSLKWVQENIALFGGDPNNVTLFGESAGGSSTHHLMVCEQTKGLIHKAIIMSGCVLNPWANPPRNEWAYRLAVQLGFKGENIDKEVYEFLMDAKGSDIVIAASKILTSEEKHNRIPFAFCPVVEPYITEQCILSKTPYEAMQNTWSHKIPLMMGATSFEGLLFFPEVTRRPATLDEVGNCKNMLPMDLNVEKDSEEATYMALKLKKTYFGDEDCNIKTKMQFLELISYREFLHPMYRTALCRVEHSDAPTYIYRFDFDSKDGNSIRNMLCGRDVKGVCHGDDAFYMFHNMLAFPATENSPERHVIRLLIDIWTSFAESNDPNCSMLGDVKFQPITKNEEFKCLNISHKCEFIELPELSKLKVWNSFYPAGKL